MHVRYLLAIFALVGSLTAQQLPHQDEIRIAEAFRLAEKIQDNIWPEWSKAPFPVLLITVEGEFLVHYARPPAGFTSAGHSDLLGSDVFVRPRKFPLTFLATFPALGDGVPVIVIGEAQNTDARASTPWVITFLHEHFHQMQYSQPDYQAGIAKLDLAKGDTSGMWMLNFPFSYEVAEVSTKFDALKAQLLDTLLETDAKQFRKKAAAYVAARTKFFAGLNADDRRYFGFQEWQEGIARYTQIKVAEAAADYKPSAAFTGLPDYTEFSDYAKHARADTEKELRFANLVTWKRVVFYSFGACEGLLLDRLNPAWKQEYFKEKFSLDSYFPR